MGTESVLDTIRVASPCHESWEDMDGDERVRFCGHCKLNVYNLSVMAREDAERLVQQTEGRLCVRFYQREDGTMLTQDCPTGRFRVMRKMALLTFGAAACPAFAVGVYHFFNALEERARQRQMRKPKWVARLEKQIKAWLNPPAQRVKMGRDISFLKNL